MLAVVAFDSGPASAAKQAPMPDCQTTAGFVPLSLCKIGSGDVVVGGKNGEQDCTNVEVDKSYKGLGLITISKSGTLMISDQVAAESAARLEIETTGIYVFGTFQVGNPACPIGTPPSKHLNARVTIVFTGPKPTCPTGGCTGFTKGIQVESLGSLQLYGRKGVAMPSESIKSVSWTYLNLPAGPVGKYSLGARTGSPVPPGGDTNLQVQADVTEGQGAWQPGDWIAIATTSYSPFETEFAQIESLTKKSRQRQH